MRHGERGRQVHLARVDLDRADGGLGQRGPGALGRAFVQRKPDAIILEFLFRGRLEDARRGHHAESGVHVDDPRAALGPDD